MNILFSESSSKFINSSFTLHTAAPACIYSHLRTVARSLARSLNIASRCVCVSLDYFVWFYLAKIMDGNWCFSRSKATISALLLSYLLSALDRFCSFTTLSNQKRTPKRPKFVGTWQKCVCIKIEHGKSEWKSAKMFTSQSRISGWPEIERRHGKGSRLFWRSVCWLSALLNCAALCCVLNGAMSLTLSAFGIPMFEFHVLIRLKP